MTRLGSIAWTAIAMGGICLLGGCSSSVHSINDRAIIAQSDARSAPVVPEVWFDNGSTEYRVGPRDVLEIDVYELERPNESKLLKARVARSGSIVLPLVGAVEAAGRTVLEVQEEIVRRLNADYIVDPTVSVIVSEHAARRVTVLGAVKKPGPVFLKENRTTLVDVLAAAEGPNDKAGSTVFVLRGSGPGVVDAAAGAPAPPRVLKVDLVDLVERGDLSVNCSVSDGDVVHVPPASHVFVTGRVKKGGSFPLVGEITLLRAVALAGGLDDHATPGETILIRTTAKGREHIPIDLSQVEAGTNSDLLMQPDDVLVINESATSETLRGIGNFFRGLFTVGYGL